MLNGIMPRSNPDKKAAARIEAALYAAGRPLKIDELVNASGTSSRRKTLEILDKLTKSVRSALEAIEIAELPDGSFVFQLKPEYSQSVRKYASRPMLSKATQKTLSYIIQEQPVSSKNLVEVRGTGVYAHLKDLRQIDFIRYEKVGRIKIYTTTDKLTKYFGIKGSSEELQAILFKTKKNHKTEPTAGTIKHIATNSVARLETDAAT